MSLRFIKTNVGFYNSKTIMSDGTFSIYKTMTQQNNLATLNTIAIDDIKYQVGLGSRCIAEKNESQTHILCTYYNIFSNCDDGDSVVLMTLLPMKNYMNDDYIDVYKATFLHNPTITAVVDGKKKTVHILDVIVYMEGASAVNLYDETFEDNVIALLDIGGNTINAGVFENGELNTTTAHTLPLGTIKLERQIIHTVDKEMGWSLQTYEVPQLLKSDNMKVKKLVDEVCTEFVNTIFNDLLEYNWNLYNLKIFCTGGGSKLLQKYLDNKFKNITFSKDPLFDNVKGLCLIEELIKDEYEKKHFNYKQSC